jgi:phage antirepressor YoqD-like protein
MKIIPIEHLGKRILLTVQLAESFGTDSQKVIQNFNNNKERYKAGKHYFLLEGDELRSFKNHNIDNFDFAPNVNRVYLWTEKGAWMVAKSLNTDEAWDAYEQLVDEYYKVIQFVIPQTLPEALRAYATEVEKNQILMIENQELKIKTRYVDTILKSKSTVTITQIAKDYGMSGPQLNKILHEEKVQYKQNKQWLLYHKHQDNGYTKSETIDITRSNGDPDVTMNTRWTQKGRLFIHEILTKRGIIPFMDRETVKTHG